MVVARIEPTVNCEVVAMSVVPKLLEVIIELAGKAVEFVPPLATVTVGKVKELTPAEYEQLMPLEQEEVVVATQVGTPPTKARVKPLVDTASSENEPALPP